MGIGVLGPLETGTESLSPRERAIHSARVVRAGRVMSPAELADAYWGEATPQTWGQQVKTSVARIRQRLGPGIVETVGSGYRLAIDTEAIDAALFERLVATARQQALRGEDDRAVDTFRRALAMWRGAALPDVPDWEPGVVEAQRLDEVRRSAEEELLEARLRADEPRAVIPDAERLVREDPLREDRWAILALANYQANRQAEALAVLRAARRRLADELGIDPGARLTALETAVLRHDPALTPVRTPDRASDVCPYRGLEPFGPDDAETFFGREADVEKLLDRARPGVIVAIAGPSGSGKSSVMLAGLVPRWAERGRTVRLLRPGSAAVATVRDAAEGPSRVDVIAIDQAEELIRGGGDVEGFCAAVARFVDGGGTVVLTVRSDFLDEAAALPHVGPAIAHDVYLLGPLSREALRQAIVEPANRARLRLEPGLVELVLRDTEGRPAALPHLSHALLETWVRREGSTLTVDGYETAGGIAGAIAQSAEDLYRSLGADERTLCRSLMLRLVESPADGAPVRRRQAAAPLLDDPARRHVVDRLVRSRLVAVDGGAVAIVHEAVASSWPRLEGWLSDEAEGGRLMASLSTATQTWDEAGRPEEDLARGARLAAFLEWRAGTQPDLTAVETEFLAASSAHEQDELRAITERATRDRRQNRRLRWLVTGVAALLVIALAAGGIAALRSGEAAASRDAARREVLVATSLALRATNPDTAALLAAELYRRWPDDPGTRSALMGTVTSAEGLMGSARIPDVVGRVSVALIPGTETAVVNRASGLLEIDDIDTGAQVRTLDPPLPPRDSELRNWLAVSADGSTLLVMRRLTTRQNEPFQPSVYDLRTGKRIGMALPVVPYTESFAISADGRTGAWVDMNATLTVADVATGVTRTAHLDTESVPGFATPALVRFTPDGTLLAGTADGRLLELDTSTLEVVRTMGPWPGSLEVAMQALDDRTVVAAGQRGIVRVDLTTGAELWHQGIGGTRFFECGRLAVSETHGLVFCGDTMNEIERRSLADGQIVAPSLKYTVGGMGELAFPTPNTLLALPNTTDTFVRWRIDGGGLTSRIIAPGLLLQESYDPTGRYILAATPPEPGMEAAERPGAPYSVWDTTTGDLVRVIDEGREKPGDGASWIGPDRLLLVDTGTDDDGEDDAFRVVDVRTGESSDAGELPVDVDHWALSPDGTLWFETHDDDGYGLDAYDGETLRRTGKHLDLGTGFPYILTFTPDGSRAAITTYEEGAVPWRTYVFDTRGARLLADGMTEAWDTRITPAGDIIGVSPRDIAVFDGTTLERVRPLPRALGQAWSMDVSRDGRTLLAWTEGRTAVQLIDLRSGRVLGDGLPATVYPAGTTAALRPDGKEMAYSVAQGIAIWDLDPAHHYEAACRIAGRELTPDEWSMYLSDFGPQRATCADVLGAGRQ